MDGKTVLTPIRGFGLIELMISLAIVGILSTLAIPTYQQHLLTSRRDSAIQQLLQLHLAQQHYRLNHSEFADNNTLQLKQTSHYKYKVLTASTDRFQLQAEAIGEQRKDLKCLLLRIDHNMQRTPRQCWE